jgi:hypothetical protein
LYTVLDSVDCLLEDLLGLSHQCRGVLSFALVSVAQTRLQADGGCKMSPNAAFIQNLSFKHRVLLVWKASSSCDEGGSLVLFNQLLADSEKPRSLRSPELSIHGLVAPDFVKAMQLCPHDTQSTDSFDFELALLRSLSLLSPHSCIVHPLQLVDYPLVAELLLAQVSDLVVLRFEHLDELGQVDA